MNLKIKEKKRILILLFVFIILINVNAQTVGTPFKIVIFPETFQAEDYDLGGEGVGYHDIDSINFGRTSYRPNDGVDIEFVDGKYSVGWVGKDEWLKFTFDVPSNKLGNYKIAARVAKETTITTDLALELDGIPKGKIRVPITGSWQTWTIASNDANQNPIFIDITSPGTHVLKVIMTSPTVGGSGAALLNFDWISFQIPTQSYNFVGCYNDDDNPPTRPRAMTWINQGQSYTIEGCYTEALTRGFTYFAMQYPQDNPNPNDAQCFGSNGGYDRYGAVTCTSRINSAGQIMGDGWQNAVYQIVNPNSQYQLTVTKVESSGSSPGNTITASPPFGLTDCAGNTCTKRFSPGTSVTLTASPDQTSVPRFKFDGWLSNGQPITGCTGTVGSPPLSCPIVMNSDKQISGSFSLAPLEQFNIAVASTGSGTINSNVGFNGINCGSGGTDCGETNINEGTSVTLTAVKGPGADFTGWSGGACTGSLLTCTFIVNQNNCPTLASGTSNNKICNIGASFSTPVSRFLSVNINPTDGSGGGVLSKNPDGSNSLEIICASPAFDCQENYNNQVSVILRAQPASTSFFTGWTGACAGTAQDCTVTMSISQNVGATFSPKAKLIVNKVSATGTTGSGSISSSPLGLTCPSTGNTCDGDFASGSPVTLTASPDSTSSFIGWTGDPACAGTSITCIVIVTPGKIMTATFGAFSAGGGGTGGTTSTISSVVIKSFNNNLFNKYVTATNEFTVPIYANKDTQGNFETFNIHDLNGGSLTSGDQVSIETYDRKFFTSAPSGGTLAVTKTATTLATADKLVIRKITGTGTINRGDIISFQHTSTNKFMVAEGGGGGVVNINRDAVGDWEKFKVEILSSAVSGGTLSVSTTGPGVVKTLNDLTQINCGETYLLGRPDRRFTICTHTYSSPTNVVLTAEFSDFGNTFLGWGGDCSGTSTTCNLNLGGSKTVSARFGPAGTGGGTGGVSSLGLQWSENGPIAGKTCVRIDEPNEVVGSGWKDDSPNYLCSTNDIGLTWKNDGQINGMYCINIKDKLKSGSSGWGNNFLCTQYDIGLRWYDGPPAPQSIANCIAITEAQDLGWKDNYICVEQSTEGCSEEETLFRFKSYTNSHAALYDKTNYPLKACVKDTGAVLIDRTCTASNEIIRLSSAENAHVQTTGTYPEKICSDNLECSYKTNCDSDESCIVSLSSEDNAHVALCSDSLYTKKLCCKSSGCTISSCGSAICREDGRTSCETNAETGTATGCTWIGDKEADGTESDTDGGCCQPGKIYDKRSGACIYDPFGNKITLRVGEVEEFIFRNELHALSFDGFLDTQTAIITVSSLPETKTLKVNDVAESNLDEDASNVNDFRVRLDSIESQGTTTFNPLTGRATFTYILGDNGLCQGSNGCTGNNPANSICNYGPAYCTIGTECNWFKPNTLGNQGGCCPRGQRWNANAPGGGKCEDNADPVCLFFPPDPRAYVNLPLPYEQACCQVSTTYGFLDPVTTY